jgi:hypothetical protein
MYFENAVLGDNQFPRFGHVKNRRWKLFLRCDLCTGEGGETALTTQTAIWPFCVGFRGLKASAQLGEYK